MIEPVVFAGVVAVIGAVLAVTARDGRLVAFGILVAMVAALLASSPAPTTLTIVFRILGSVLAAYLLWAATRARSVSSEGSGVGPLAEIAAAAAAFSVGWFVAPVKPLAGPLAAQAAGIALVALAMVPLTGRDVLRVGVGAVVMVIGGSLLLEAWVGPASSLGQIVVTALLVGIVGATSVLISPIDTPAARRVAAAQVDAEVTAPAPQSVAASSVQAAAPAVEAVAAAAPGANAARMTAPATAAESVLAAGPAPARRVPSGPMVTRKVRKKAGRGTGAEDLAGPAASSEPPAARHTRAASVRTSPTRSVREGRPESEPSLDEATPPDEEEVPLAPLPQSRWIVNRVRRLRPREPRR